MNTPLISFIELLKSVERGNLSCTEARLQLQNNPLENFPESEVILSQLNHYWDDEDIRQSDLGYRMMQNGEIAKLIHRLQKADFSGAAQISFLHVS